MDKDLLYNFLPSIAVNSGSLDILYSFSTGSGSVVFNELYDNDSHFLNDNVEYLNGSIYPGIATGDGKPSSQYSSGTGNFNGNDGVVISPSYNRENWTFFLNFSGFNTAMEAISLNKPIVTLPELFMRKFSAFTWDFAKSIT